VATGTWKGKDVMIWDVERRRLLRSLTTDSSASVWFSPDNRLLLIADEYYRMWDTQSWKKIYDGPASSSPVGWAAFSPDSQIVAVVVEGNLVQLLDARTGIELAQLEAPQRAVLSWLRFSPDGSKLFALEWSRSVQIWDLRRVRKELAALNLDWGFFP
jgi:WD40 repeat protein